MGLFLLMGCGENQVVEQPTAVPPTEAVPTETAVPTATPEPEEPFRVIAYLTSAIIPETIPYDKLTHINYSFLIPNADGTFNTIVNGWKLKQIAEEAHAADVEVIISVGGWGWEKQFEQMAANAETRAAFVDNLVAFVDEYDLDGADIDWEYPQAGEQEEHFTLLIRALREAMPDKVLTTAVVSHGVNGEGISDETLETFDFINVMTYAGPEHGTMEQYERGFTYWEERGVPADKLVMGVPFYGLPQDVIYRKAVEADPALAYVDEFEWNGSMVFHNGIPTIQKKTEMAMEDGGGIMFWTLDHDSFDEELSLLTAIDDVVKGDMTGE